MEVVFFLLALLGGDLGTATLGVGWDAQVWARGYVPLFRPKTTSSDRVWAGSFPRWGFEIWQLLADWCQATTRSAPRLLAVLGVSEDRRAGGWQVLKREHAAVEFQLWEGWWVLVVAHDPIGGVWPNKWAWLA